MVRNIADANLQLPQKTFSIYWYERFTYKVKVKVTNIIVAVTYLT